MVCSKTLAIDLESMFSSIFQTHCYLNNLLLIMTKSNTDVFLVVY